MHNLPPAVEFSTVVGDDEESCTVAECVIAVAAASPLDSASDMSDLAGMLIYWSLQYSDSSTRSGEQKNRLLHPVVLEI